MDERDLLKQQAIRQDRAQTLEVADAGTLNQESIASINESRKKTGLALTYKDHPIVLNQERPIGTGGSKQVYSVQIGEQHYALAIPAAGIDTPTVILKKWRDVIKEPINTDRVKKLGLYANDLCHLVLVKINGIQFPALVMKRFEDLPYEVRDSKNHLSSIGETKILSVPCSEAELEKAFDFIADEVELLIKNNVKLSRDSFNLAIVSGKAHLYFNDLGTAKFEAITTESLEKYIDAYLDFAIAAFLSGVTEAIIDDSTGEEPDYDSLKEKLRSKLIERLS